MTPLTPDQLDVIARAEPLPRLTLPYPPSVNHLYSTVRGRRVLSKAGRQYKERVRSIAEAAGYSPRAGDMAVSVDVYRPARRGDLDNTLKSLLDSLTG